VWTICVRRQRAALFIHATATQGDAHGAAFGARSQAREAIRRCRRSATRGTEGKWRHKHVDGAIAGGLLQYVLAGQHLAVDVACGAKTSELLNAWESWAATSGE